MAPASSNKVQIKHISRVTDETIDFISKRRDGIEKSLKTRWEKFNAVTMGGIEPNTVMTIAGISGSGKSSFANMLETDIVDMNPNENIVVLSFSFEMLSSRQVARKLSNKMKRTTRRLFSADSPLTDVEFEYAVRTADKIKRYPIYYVDQNCKVEDIRSIVTHFQNTIAKDKWLVVIIDHTLLISGASSEGERAIIVDLEKYLIEAKKVGKTSIIQLSQLNREIEKSERINNPIQHYPMRSDLSSSDAMFQASDYVLVIHRPEILHITSYGPENLPTQDVVFLHFLKNREGDVKILRFTNDLRHNNLAEYVENK